MTPRSTQLSKQTDSGYPSYLDVIPRMGTLRNFANPTYGTRMGMVARLLGQPFMPWQQYVADVIGEVDPRTGIRIYREAYLTTMRQVGKTTFVIVTKAHTALDTPVPVRTLFAAQEGKSAIAKMVEHAELVRRTPLGRKLAAGTPVTSNGKEHVAWSNGSTEWPLSEKESSGHGSTIALGAITEAMAHRDDRYITTMQPAMNVNPNALLLVESTQGNAKSLYWNEQTAELEERWSADPAELTNARTAFFNFSFGPDDDIGSADTWRHRIPSIGHTLRLEEVEHAWLNATTPKKLRAFKRNFGNIADLGAGDDTVLTDEQWEASASDAIIVGRRAFTLDITNDGSWATIAWGGMNTDNRVQAEVVKHERSMHWVLPYFGQLFDLNPRAPRRVYVVAGSRAAAMAERFSAADIEMIVLPRSEYAAAVTDWFDGITDESGPTTVHARNNQSPLDIAIGGASWTKSKPPVWDDGLSRTIISPLVATSIAPWAFQLELKRAEEIEDLLETVA